MELPSSVISWIFDCLTGRLQYVRLNGLLSSAIRTNTGAPQSTVLAPFLFVLYTADCRITDESCPLVNLQMIQNWLDRLVMMKMQYTTSRLKTVNWCDKNYLYLNVSKTKEMCINFLGRIKDAPNHCTLKEKQ